MFYQAIYLFTVFCHQTDHNSFCPQDRTKFSVVEFLHPILAAGRDSITRGKPVSVRDNRSRLRWDHNREQRHTAPHCGWRVLRLPSNIQLRRSQKQPCWNCQIPTYRHHHNQRLDNWANSKLSGSCLYLILF